MNNQKGNLYLIIAIIVGLFAIGAVGFASWKYFGGGSELEKQTQPVYSPEKEKTVPQVKKQEEIIPSGKVNEMADWKSYRNEKYRYSFRYPIGATISEAPLGDFIAVENYKENYEKYTGKICINIKYNQAELYISASDNKDDKYVLCPFKGLGIGEEFSGKPISESVIIAGKTYIAEGTEITFKKTGFCDEILNLATENGTTFYYYVIGAESETELLSQKTIIHQILSTFKFTE